MFCIPTDCLRIVLGASRTKVWAPLLRSTDGESEHKQVEKRLGK